MAVNLNEKTILQPIEESRQELVSFLNSIDSPEELQEIRRRIGLYYSEKLVAKVTEASDRLGLTHEDFDSILNDPNQ